MVSKEASRSLDAYLVSAAKLGDRRAYDRLIRLWNPRLEAHAARLLGDRGKAQDAVQDGWIEIFRNLGRLRDDRAFAAWAYRIVSRRCARTIGQAQRDRRLQRDAANEARVSMQLMEDAPPPGNEKQRLKHALLQLPPKQKAAIALHYLEELSVAEVALALDIPPGTVKTRLMHGRMKLKQALEEHPNE